MRKLDLNSILFVVGVVIAANSLIFLVFSVVLGSGLVSTVIWGALALLGLYLASMTWRQALRFLLQPQDRRGSDG